jgi:hypothetical protein
MLNYVFVKCWANQGENSTQMHLQDTQQYSRTNKMHFWYSVYYDLTASTCFKHYLPIFRKGCINNWHIACVIMLAGCYQGWIGTHFHSNPDSGQQYTSCLCSASWRWAGNAWNIINWVPKVGSAVLIYTDVSLCTVNKTIHNTIMLSCYEKKQICKNNIVIAIFWCGLHICTFTELQYNSQCHDTFS